ncbi:MAG: phosphopantetheinyl transferase [Acidobacteriales bacterium]|nr:phosphopantetheinyl transferase [Terriglobales bacterium]
MPDERLERLLSLNEKHRASRFRFDKDRRQFIASHALLRWILSLYAGIEPEELEFTHNAFGKPKLNSRSSGNELNFNYSHSHDVAVFAFAKGKQVGIDVELIQPEVLHEAIPEHFFSSFESGTLRSVPIPQQSFDLFKCWTRKEAYVKARGAGLQIPLDSFAVSGERVQFGRQESEWALQSFTPADNYVGALATEGECSSTIFIQSAEKLLAKEGVPCCTS